MKKYSNSLERLMRYYSLFTYQYESSISYISQFYEIPLSVVRKDFATILNCANAPFYLLDESDADFCSSELIISGQYDESLWGYFDITENDYFNNLLCIPVNVDEYLAYNNLYEQHSFPKQIYKENSYVSSSIRNKKYLTDFNPTVLEHLETIESAILDNNGIVFKYKLPQTHVSEVHIKPIRIGFDATENRYVVITTYLRRVCVYDLDYIMGTIKIDSENDSIVTPELLSKSDKVWGFDFNSCFNEYGEFVPALRVKVCFFDEANVINKVRRDLTYRNPLNLELDTQGNLIYEDDVYGIDSFIQWILGFGSSVKILSPDSLIDSIKAIYLSLISPRQ